MPGHERASRSGRRKPASASVPRETRSLPSVAQDWGEQFVKHLEIWYADSICRSDAETDWRGYRQAMVSAFVATMRDAGADPKEIAQLLAKSIGELSSPRPPGRWTEKESARRLELIDKQIQQSLSVDEMIELARLTSLLRASCDTEENVPLEGAKRLHRQLLGKNPRDRAPN